MTNLAKSTPKPSQKTVLALTLVIRATENSWVSASADGQLVTEETLIAPAHTSIRAAREISVRVGNAAGVSFILNGQEIATEGRSRGAELHFRFQRHACRFSRHGNTVDKVVC